MSKPLRNAIGKMRDTFDKVETLYYGVMGVVKGNKKHVSVPGRPGYVYIRLRSLNAELIEAANDKVEPKYNLPVTLRKQGRRYVVVEVNRERYLGWDTENPNLPRHGKTHTFNKDGDKIGSDGVFVSSYQFLPYLLSPFPSKSAQNAFIFPYADYYKGSWRYYGNTGTASFIPYKPVSGTSLVLVSVDYETGNPHYLSTTGTYITSQVTGISQVLEFVPAPPSGAIVPIGVVRLTNATKVIEWQNIYDLRKHFGISSGSSSGGGGGISDHNSLSGLQGGTTNQYYHLTLSQRDDLTDGGVTTLHEHNYPTGTNVFGGLYGFGVEGALAITSGATTPILLTTNTTISQWRAYLEDTGVGGSTNFDVTVTRTGSVTSIFNNGVTDNRPEIPWNDTDGIISAEPLIVNFLANDILKLNIEQIATGSANAVLVPVGVESLSSLEITDGTVDVLHVNKISVENVELIDNGNGQITIKGYRPNYFIIPHLFPESVVGFVRVAGSGYGYWLQSSGAQNDEAVWNIELPAGTYTLHIAEIKDTNRGIYHWYLDGVEIGTADAYGSGAVELTIVGGVVSAMGSVEIKLKMETKNVSSSAYYGTIFGLTLQRTA